MLPRLRAAGHNLTGCADQAEDLAQETVLKLLQRARVAGPPDHLAAYALTTLRNLARSRRRATRPTVPLTEDVATTLPTAFARVELAETCRAISKLPPRQAQLLMLVAQGETSPASLARRTGQPTGTVMSRLARARASLREATGEEV